MIAWLLAGTAVPLIAGNFAQPAEGPVAFRRDRVPLDVDTMAKLSAQLTNLADGMAGGTARERRGAAQMLALSIALDPANTKARALLDSFEKEKHHADADTEKTANSRARIWQSIGWLESPEAGPDGLALAACLKDVVVISDPQDPRSKDILEKGEGGAWTDWIPATAAYEEVTLATKSPDDEGPKVPIAKPGILLNNATVMTPLWRQTDKSENAKWALTLAPLHMTAESAPEGNAAKAPFSIVMGKPAEGSQLTPLTGPVLRVLLQQHGKLPVGCTVHIDSPELEASLVSKKKQSISAATAVLASAAISGREPDATIIGSVDATGAFKLPTGFWEQLRAVGNGTGTGKRLILPAEAATYLPSMLAMENPRFFMDHEVLLAANFQQLLELSAKSRDDAFGKISAQFQEIREKAGTQPLGQYVANSFIRRRLAEIGQAAPFHYSARMLAIQGAGNRPIFVIRPVLVSELRRAIEPMEWLVKHGHTPFLPAEVEAIGTSFEACRSEIEHLLRYTDKGDRALVDQVQDMVTLLRPLDRAAKARPDPYSTGSISAAQEAAYSALLQSHAAVISALADPTEETESLKER
ncbi:MAG: hypothetical protein ABIS50_12585 [Luteolibacter sp.]|uniref:hypothetical protein n=1 Tax=Luteolibacter sp. TaxID=1962973 RepID=UPI00326382AE